MILFKVGDMLDRFPDWIAKPLGACVPCSASGIGTIAYLLVMHGDYSLRTWAIYIISAAFVNSLLWFAYTAVYERTQEIRQIQEIRSRQHQGAVVQRENIIGKCDKCGENGKNNKNSKLEK